MKTPKRLFSVLVSGALVLSLTTLPSGAVQSSFSDITDPATAVNADILRLMGVVSGTGGNLFDPGGVLSRAQFCTMVINFMQQEDQVPLHNTRTIFSDVAASHWARGYVNLAASLTQKDGEREVPLVSGVGDGQFKPDDPITQAQAATILIRVLGYTGTQSGSVWPQSYMNLAGSIGLLNGLSGGYMDPLTRAQAAQLFVNALSCKTGGEGSAKFYTTLGSEEKENILLAVDVESDTGAERGAIRTSGGTYLPKNEGVKPSALTGKRGSLILNDKKEIVTFLPDDSESTVITLAENAQSSGVKDRSKQYTIDSTTPVYTGDSAEGKSYLDSYTSLYAGTQLTLYTERGKVVAVYTTSTTTSIEADAVVVMGRISAATFHQLTGGADSFNVIKNREQVGLSYIRPYDVVTYDKLTNTLIASDLRLPCVYWDASPNTRTPTSITVHGTKFDVLESAWDSIQNFNMGDKVLLLLTADGKVAGMASEDSGLRSTAIGFINGKSAELFLPNGGTMTLSVTGLSDSLSNRLVTYSADKDGLHAARFSSAHASGSFLPDEMKLGSYTVSAGVRVFEQTPDGVMTPISLDQLGHSAIDKSDIAAYRLNSSNAVDFIVLDAVTGNAYEYGIIVSVLDSRPYEVVDKDENGNEIREPVLDANGKPMTDEEGKPITTVKTHTEYQQAQSWKLVRGSGTIEFGTYGGYNGKSGDVVGVVSGPGQNKDVVIASSVKLTEVKNVQRRAFFERDGQYYVNVNNQSYRVADNVECFRSGSYLESDIWFSQATGAERLDACLAYSDNMTLYVDPIGHQVRVIEAK